MKRLFWRSASTATAAVALMFGGLAASATADADTNTATVEGGQAVAGMADCPSSYFCVWVNKGFNDGPGKWQDNESNYLNWGHASCQSHTWNDCASSVYNHGENCNLNFYANSNYSGAFYALPRGSYLADMTLDRMTDGRNANDRISSHKWCTF